MSLLSFKLKPSNPFQGSAVHANPKKGQHHGHDDVSLTKKDQTALKEVDEVWMDTKGYNKKLPKCKFGFVLNSIML